MAGGGLLEPAACLSFTFAICCIIHSRVSTEAAGVLVAVDSTRPHRINPTCSAVKTFSTQGGDRGPIRVSLDLYSSSHMSTLE